MKSTEANNIDTYKIALYENITNVLHIDISNTSRVYFCNCLLYKRTFEKANAVKYITKLKYFLYFFINFTKYLIGYKSLILFRCHLLCN